MWIIPNYIKIENDCLRGSTTIPIKDIEMVAVRKIRYENMGWYEVRAIRKDFKEFLLITSNFLDWAEDIAEDVRKALGVK